MKTPVFTSSDTQVTKLQNYEYQIIGVDADMGSGLTLVASQSPSWLSFNEDTQT